LFGKKKKQEIENILNSTYTKFEEDWFIQEWLIEYLEKTANNMLLIAEAIIYQ